MKIYTKGGDRGQTSLANGKRISKADVQIDTYGTADELNSFVGLLRSKINEEEQAKMEWIQNKLFNLGAALAGAEGEDWIKPADVEQLEEWIDAYQSQMEPLRAFVLPGGSEKIALSHVCRTVTRRLERRMVECFQENEQYDKKMGIFLQFVNRLSDFWFILALKMAKNDKNELFLWKK